jgi:hypothetical protein
MTDIRTHAIGMRAGELAAEERAGGAMTESEFRDPATRQLQADLELRNTRAALKPLLDKLAEWETRHGVELSDRSVITTTVGLLREVRAAVEKADG